MIIRSEIDPSDIMRWEITVVRWLMTMMYPIGAPKLYNGASIRLLVATASEKKQTGVCSVDDHFTPSSC